MARRSTTMVWMLLLCQSWITSIQAQDAVEDPTIQEAKRLFDEAADEVRAGQAHVARDLLRQSLALYPTTATRYNLGLALRLTGETTEAIATFEGLLRDTSLPTEQRSLIESELAGARAELAAVAVQITGSSSATVEIDGRTMGTVSANDRSVFTLDAGDHIVVARAGGTTRQSVHVDQGQSVTVTLHVLSLAEANAEERRHRRRKRAGWITGGIAVATAIVVGAVVASQRQSIGDGDFPATGTLSQTSRRR